MKMAGWVQCMFPGGIQDKSDSMNENGWLSPTFVSTWNKEQIRLNKLEWLVRSTVFVHVEYRPNPT